MLLALIPDPLRWPIGGADADRGKVGFELALRPGPPARRLPFGSGIPTRRLLRAFMKRPGGRDQSAFAVGRCFYAWTNL
jgi:hypothetical protein